MNDTAEKLYNDIRVCTHCSFNDYSMGQKQERNGDFNKVSRRIDAVDLSSKVVVISEALAEKGLRKSGVSFFETDGSFLDSGKRLESFLNAFGYSLKPPRNVTLDSCAPIKMVSDGLRSVYCTETVQCFPGRNKKGKMINPSSNGSAVKNCLIFLKRELLITTPQLILLHGRVAWESFYKEFLPEEWRRLNNKVGKMGGLFKNHMNVFFQSHSTPIAIPRITIDLCGTKKNVSILPIFHSSSGSGCKRSFDELSTNQELIRNIKSIISEK